MRLKFRVEAFIGTDGECPNIINKGGHLRELVKFKKKNN